jgi:hypothetical protein
MLTQLDNELATYQARKSDLLAKARGKFVLIKNDQVLDIFETEMDAIRQGYERLGNVPFLVKEILEVETPLNFTSNLIKV